MDNVEIWKPILGYENRYEISSLGRIQGLVDTHGTKLNEPKFLKPYNVHGYLTVKLQKDGHIKNVSIHSLVCEAFHGHRPKKHVVNHIDGNTFNNKSNNLEWVTHKENSQHAKQLGRYKRLKGIFSPSSVCSLEGAKEILKCEAII